MADLNNIKKTLFEQTRSRPTAPANQDFIQGAAQVAKNRAASAEELMPVGQNKFGLLGATTSDVVNRFGINFSDLENQQNAIKNNLDSASSGQQANTNAEPTLRKTTPQIAGSNLLDLQKKVLESLVPTQNEQQLQQQINQLISGRDLGVAGLEGQGRAIPLDLVRGQQAKLQEQAALQLAPLQRQLGLEQGTRQAEQQAAQTMLQFQDSRNQQLFNIAKDLSVGERVQLPDGTVVQGIKPTAEREAFFKSSDVVNLMKQLPRGQSTTIVDPNTGEELIIHGFSDPETPDVYVAEDRFGNVTAVNKNTGETIWSASGIAKGFANAGGGGGTTGQTEEEQAFYDDIAYAQEQLRKGATWGQMFNFIKTKYGAPGDIIDELLDKQTWAQGGAFQQFKG